MPDIHDFIAKLREATFFEDAALVILRAALETTAARLQASPFAKSGRVLRGMLHLRPGDGYRRLVVADAAS
ncbi:MAG TPA: sigma-54-dependent Fis family transcriptional regulator, partial [Polyangium sp.]|nr:sigma-54-dependent Fis family transcriptional regulator [Polyangium sp.]